MFLIQIHFVSQDFHRTGLWCSRVSRRLPGGEVRHLSKGLFFCVFIVVAFSRRLLINHVSLQRSSSSWCVLELQSTRTKLGRRYRVVRYWKDDLAAKVWCHCDVRKTSKWKASSVLDQFSRLPESLSEVLFGLSPLDFLRFNPGTWSDSKLIW